MNLTTRSLDTYRFELGGILNSVIGFRKIKIYVKFAVEVKPVALIG